MPCASTSHPAKVRTALSRKPVSLGNMHSASHPLYAFAASLSTTVAGTVGQVLHIAAGPGSTRNASATTAAEPDTPKCSLKDLVGGRRRPKEDKKEAPSTLPSIVVSPPELIEELDATNEKRTTGLRKGPQKGHSLLHKRLDPLSGYCYHHGTYCGPKRV